MNQAKTACWGGGGGAVRHEGQDCPQQQSQFMKVCAELSGTWNGGASPYSENLGCFIPYKEVIQQFLVAESRKLMKAPQGLAAPMTPAFSLKTLRVFFSSS